MGTRILDEGDDVITPEELVAYREWVRIMEFKDNAWPCMALTHIDQQAARIAELAAQVTALKKIAISERSRCIRTESYDHCEGMYRIDLPEAIESSRRQLAEEHPEVFR